MSFQLRLGAFFYYRCSLKLFFDCIKLGLILFKSFDSLREITDSMFPGARKLARVFMRMMLRRSTFSDTNASDTLYFIVNSIPPIPPYA